MSQTQINMHLILEGCRKQNRQAQRKLYEHFYGYGMSICLRYARNREDALEIFNDGFLKVFNKIEQFDSNLSFEAWLRRILINTAIDHQRNHFKHKALVRLTEEHEAIEEAFDLSLLDSTSDLLPVLQELSPAYRTVFNLFVMDGYKHREIAEMLGISVQTSRSNFVRAKQKLKAILLKKKDKNFLKRISNG